MEVGDEIISVNDIKVNTMKYDEVMQLLHSTQEPVLFEVTKPDVITGSSSIQSPSRNNSSNVSGTSSPIPNQIQSKPLTPKSNIEIQQSISECKLSNPGFQSSSTKISLTDKQIINKSAINQIQKLQEHNIQRNFSKNNSISSNSQTYDPKTNKIKVGEETLIEIDRGKLGLGLSIVGGSDTQLQGIIIHDIYQSGAAYRDKRLAIGDQIIKVNNIDLTIATHEQALIALRQTSDSVKLLVHRGFYSNNDPEQSTIESNEKNCEQLCAFGSSIDDEKFLNVIHIELNKKFGKGLGFSIIGRRNGSGVFISHIVRNLNIFQMK